MFTIKHAVKEICIGMFITTLLVSTFAPPASAAQPTDSASYVGTWKGTTYTGKGTYSDVTLALNADGSYSCSGFPAYTTDNNQWTLWQAICLPPDKGLSSKWELLLPTVIRFTYVSQYQSSSTTSQPMSLVSIYSFDGKNLVLDIPSGANLSSSMAFSEFVKQ